MLDAAIILACENHEAFRPLSYALPPPLLPVRGQPALERVLRGVVAAGARTVVVLADHRFPSLQRWLETFTVDAQVSLAHHDQLASAPARLREQLDPSSKVLLCAWNALWAEQTDGPAMRRLQAHDFSGDRLLALTLPAESFAPAADVSTGRVHVTSGVAARLDLLATMAEVFAFHGEMEAPGEWLYEILQTADTMRLPYDLVPVEGTPLLDGVAAYQRALAGFAEGKPVSSDDLFQHATARLDDNAALYGPGILGPDSVVEADATVEACILLGDNRVGRGSRLRHVLLGPGESVPVGCRLAFACVSEGEVVPLRAPPLVPGAEGMRPKRGRRKIQEHASRLARPRHPRRKRPELGEAMAQDGRRPTLIGGVDSRQIATYARRLLGHTRTRDEAPSLEVLALPSGFQNKVCLVTRAGTAEPDLYEADAAGRPRAAILKWALKSDAQPLWIEHHCMHALGGAGIAARSYFLDLRRDPFPHPVLLCQALPGRELRSSDLDAGMLARMGRLLRQVHAHEGEALWESMPTFPSYGFGDLGDYMTDTVDMFRYYARYREDVSLPDDALMGCLYHCVERLLKFVDESLGLWETANGAAWPLKLCHGDLVPHNFLYDRGSGRLFLIDWERAGVGDPAYELAWFVALNGLAPEDEETFLGAYLDGVPRTGPAGADAVRARIQAYRRITAISWPIQILAYQARYWRERFPVTMEPADYVAFNQREAYRRLVDGFTFLGSGLGGWKASVRQLEDMGKLLVSP